MCFCHGPYLLSEYTVAKRQTKKKTHTKHPLIQDKENVQVQKISILPPGGRSSLRTKNFKKMYEAYLEFSEGWGGGGGS